MKISNFVFKPLINAKIKACVSIFVMMLMQSSSTPIFCQEILTVPDGLEKRCVQSEDPASCYELGLFLYKTNNPTQKSSGMVFIRKGCEFEMSHQCNENEALVQAQKSASLQKEMDKKVHDKNLEYSQGLMTEDEKACWDGEAESCNKAGIHYTYLSMPIDTKRGVELYKEGCRLGNKSSCDGLKLITKGMAKVFSVETE